MKGLTQGSVVILLIAIVLMIITIWQVYVLYAQADKITCDSFGNCMFTTIKSYGECYQNSEKVNCSEDVMKIMENMTIDGKMM
jgi:hypothetical protein